MKKTTEDYLKTICLLEKRCGEVRSVHLAEALGVSKPTVSNTVRRLIREGYVTMDGNHALRLTGSGREIACATLERNRTIREMLICLGVDEETAEKDACEMEHSISARSAAAIKRLAGERLRGKKPAAAGEDGTA